VERLERFSADKIELSGGSEVLQYRDEEVIPVLRWGDLVDQVSRESGDLYGIILSDGEHRMCLLVDEIVDIIEVSLEIKRPAQQEFFLGTAVILDQATEVVDVFDVIKRGVPDCLNKPVADKSEGVRQRILFVEDAPFFRNLVVPVLQAMNCEVWIAGDGLEACKILADQTPDLILTDLEMPNMDGYDLASWITEQTHLQGIPVVALTATPPKGDDERCQMFDAVLVKFDRQTLTETLQKIMHEHMGNTTNNGDAQSISNDQA